MKLGPGCTDLGDLWQKTCDPCSV